MTSTIEPLETPSTLTMDILRDAERQMREIVGIPPRLLATPRAYDILREQSARIEDSFVRPLIHSYLGLSIWRAPERLFRQPDKPLKSRPRRTYVRAHRKPVKAERVKIRRAYARVSGRYWKGRKVPDRRGYSQSTIFLINPDALIA